MTRMQIWGKFHIHPIAKPQLPPELLNSTNIPSGSHPKKSQVINMSQVMENEKMEKQKTKTNATHTPTSQSFPEKPHKALLPLCSFRQAPVCAASEKQNPCDLPFVTPLACSLMTMGGLAEFHSILRTCQWAG